MEIFLQLYDDLDDLAGVVRFAWPKIAGLCIAVLLFIATGIACILVPRILALTLAGIGSLILLEIARQRRWATLASRRNS